MQEVVVTDTTPKQAALWEDFIDIFYAPSDVFARRANGNPWPVLIIVTVLLLLLSLLTFDKLQPVYEPIVRRSMEKAMAANPQFTQDMMETSMRRSMKFTPWFPIFTPVLAMIAALVVWLVGKLFGSVAGYTQSLTIVAYACILFVGQSLVTSVEALTMDISQLNNPAQLTLSGARFADVATTSPWLYGLLAALDVFTLWRLALLAIGLHVIGKTSKAAGWSMAALFFVIIVLTGVRGAMQMAG